MKWTALIAMFCAGAATAQTYRDVENSARLLFSDLPEVILLDAMDMRCGADVHNNPYARYCTTKNEIYLLKNQEEPMRAYRLAHVLSHAAQVRHGIADIALREIRRRPDEEITLRQMVTRQVECLAGVFLAEAGFSRFDLRDYFEKAPFEDAHWGRDPLRIGPVVSLPLDERAKWVLQGQAEGLAGCSSGEIDVKVLLDAPGYRG